MGRKRAFFVLFRLKVKSETGKTVDEIQSRVANDKVVKTSHLSYLVGD